MISPVTFFRIIRNLKPFTNGAFNLRCVVYVSRVSMFFNSMRNYDRREQFEWNQTDWGLILEETSIYTERVHSWPELVMILFVTKCHQLTDVISHVGDAFSRCHIVNPRVSVNSGSQYIYVSVIRWYTRKILPFHVLFVNTKMLCYACVDCCLKIRSKKKLTKCK